MGSGAIKRVQGQQLSILERVKGLQNSLSEAVTGVNEGFAQIDKRFADIERSLIAVIHVVGQAEVQTARQAIQEEEERQEQENALNTLNAMIADGRVVAVSEVNDKALLVGYEKTVNAEGAEISKRFQIPFQQLKPEFKEQLLGKSTGFSFPTETGGTFEIAEVYVLTDKPAPAPEAQAAVETAPEAVAEEVQAALN